MITDIEKTNTVHFQHVVDVLAGQSKDFSQKDFFLKTVGWISALQRPLNWLAIVFRCCTEWTAWCGQA